MQDRVDGSRVHTENLEIMGRIANQRTLFLLYILNEADSKGVISLNSGMKKRLFKQIGSKAKDPSSVVKTYLALYCKADIMTAMGGGDFLVNPLVASKYKDFTASVHNDSKNYVEYKARKREGTSTIIGGE